MRVRPLGTLGTALWCALIMTQQAHGAADTWPNGLDPTAETHTLLLWAGGAPGALGTAVEDQPSLTLYSARQGFQNSAPAAAVIIAPGGSYQRLATNHEGRQVANWFNSLGVTAFVLQYRVGPRYRHPVEMQDGQRAVRYVRAHARELGVRPDQIGFMGFSAGGHLASTVETHFDAGNPSSADPVERVGSRPDFAILAYPVISMTASYRHTGSVTNLLGENPDPKLALEMSAEFHVTPETPPTFLFSTSADTTVPAENSIAFYQALHKAGVPAELHIFEKGGHGVGLALGDPALGEWSTLLRNWLRSRGLLAG